MADATGKLFRSFFIYKGVKMARGKNRRNFISKKQREKDSLIKAENSFPEKEFDDYWKKNFEENCRGIKRAVLDNLSTERIYMNVHAGYGRTIRQELRGRDIEKFCTTFPEKINTSVLYEVLPELSSVIYNIVLDSDNTAVIAYTIETKEKAASKVIMKYLKESKKSRDIIEYLRNNLTELDVFDSIAINPNYRQKAAGLKKSMHSKRLLLENIQQSTPGDYTELFPLARRMKRKFILHIGPTNSGKTYQAMEELGKADSGIYLAPLRLLAYEQYERMNRAGIPCSMITGEEQILMPGSFHQSSTIEMADLRKEWDMAVIDEAQMVADEQRGGSWTAAILGLLCPVIHLCASPDAEKMLIRMVLSCGDDYEVVYHERKTPLVMDESASDFRFPADVKKGDALIVFARKDVHSVAAELQEGGIKCSIVYGSLPYDVRHREARKFADGETDVVVATDAIGMGMNLPIRRIVFLETFKYDGYNERPLTPSEVRQIAGRAGRFGIYDTGYVTSYYDYEQIETALSQRVPPLSRAMISIPEEFLYKDGKVSTILEMWNKIPASEFYDKGDISEKIAIARALEGINDNRDLIRQFIRIPTDPDRTEIFKVYTDYYRLMTRDMLPDLYSTMDEYSAEYVDTKAQNALQTLEMYSAIYDFLYAFTRMFGDKDDLDSVIAGKRLISGKIFEILDRQKLNLRECRVCGRKLKWSYRFNVCQECYRKDRNKKIIRRR